MSEQDLDRNEPATPHKLEEARKKGQVAKSADLVSALVFSAAMLYFHASGFEALQDQFRFGRLLLVSAVRPGTSEQVFWPAVSQAAVHGALLLLPVLLLIMCAAILANVIQTRAVWSTSPVKPDWQRLNPITGFKRVFSLRTLFETARALIKLALMGIVIYHALLALVPQFHEIAGLSGLAFAKTLHKDLASVGWKLALTMLIIALIDLGYTRREFSKKMRMSHREMKDEYKNREGDPRIRRRIRELQREMLKRSNAIAQTRKASVLLTNPTHYAVALRYEHGKMAAPVLISKGAGMVAKAMRVIAARHSIPVVASPSLTRALYVQMETDQGVPAAHYAAVAKIMIWVLSMKRTRDEMLRQAGATP